MADPAEETPSPVEGSNNGELSASNVTREGEEEQKLVSDAGGNSPDDSKSAVEDENDGSGERSSDDGDSPNSEGGVNDTSHEEGLAIVGIAANEVKNIILQVLSPYFDDDGGGGGGGGGANTGVGTPTTASPTTKQEEGGYSSGEGNAEGGAGKEGESAAGRVPAGGAAAPLPPDEDEDTAQRYGHIKAKSWVQLICDGITERLVAMNKPFKFVTHIMVMRKCGAGMHICSSNYYCQTDGWLSHAHDLSPHIYAVVTVYWMAI